MIWMVFLHGQWSAGAEGGYPLEACTLQVNSLCPVNKYLLKAYNLPHSSFKQSWTKASHENVGFKFI